MPRSNFNPVLSRFRRVALPTLSLGCALLANALPGMAETAGPGIPASVKKSLSIEKIGGYSGGAFGAAEITAYDRINKRLFVVNGANGSLDVLNLSAPSAPTRVTTISTAALGGSVNSVAVFNGLVAVAIEASLKTNPGLVAFYDGHTLQLRSTVTVGALPDMLAFTPDGLQLLVANEGEPNSYGQADSVDPEGSISVITVNQGLTPVAATADFKAYIGKEAELRAAGVRIYGPGANAAQDFEPEYITISKDGKTAYVTLQENNAVAIVDIAGASVSQIKPLGYKDHHIPGMGLDASDEDAGTNTNSGAPAIKIMPRPVKGMYQPDAIASYQVAGVTYLVTANEGDTRSWAGFDEEVRIRAHCSAGLDPAVFPDAANLILDSNLGRLRITTTPNGGSAGKNAAGQCNELYSYGARSFSIWTTDLQRIYDSGDAFEQRTRALGNVKFNASNDNDNLDSRSPAKGPEPEGVILGKLRGRTYAFIGLERVGGVMVYDVSDPYAPVYVTYLNTRTGTLGDRGPEGLTLIEEDASPNGVPLLIVGNETSGTTAIYQINLGNQGSAD